MTFNPQPKNKPVRLKGKKKAEFKARVYKRDGGKCQDPKCDTPDRVLPRSGSVFEFAHLSHIKSYGAGGGDTMDNVKWKCNHCHIEIEHGPQWGKGAI